MILVSINFDLAYALSLPVKHRIPVAYLSSSILCCRLLLSAAVPETRCRHFLPVSFRRSLVFLFLCILRYRYGLLKVSNAVNDITRSNVWSSQCYFLVFLWSSVAPGQFFSTAI